MTIEAQSEETEAPVNFSEAWASAEAAAEAAEAGDPQESPRPQDGGVETRAEQGEPVDRAKMEQLRSLAKELGMAIDDGAISVSERVKFRQEQARKRGALQEEQEAFKARFSQAVEALEHKYGSVAELKEAWDSGDHDAYAKAHGFKNFGELTQEYVAQHNNPDRKKMREIEGKLQQAEAEREQRAEQERSRQHQSHISQREQAYRNSLTEDLSAIGDPLITRGLMDQSFVANVVEVQKRHYDRRTRTTISAQEAAEEVIDNTRGWWNTLNKFFGDQAPTPERHTAAGTRASQPGVKRPSKTVSLSATADASRDVVLDEDDPNHERLWKAKWAQALEKNGF